MSEEKAVKSKGKAGKSFSWQASTLTLVSGRSGMEYWMKMTTRRVFLSDLEMRF